MARQAQANSVLDIEGLQVHYPMGGGLFGGRKRVLKAVDGLSFDLHEGETLGIVGESGCGKSSLGRAVCRLISPAGGVIRFDGEDLAKLSDRAMVPYRRDIQMIFQSPLASLNPRMTVGDIIAEPLEVFEPGLSKAERQSRVSDIMGEVGLLPGMANRYPNEFSGGQAQRIMIARAMISRPRVLVCDEAVSALDVSIKAQIINLLKKLQRETGVALIFISHDLAVVRQISHRILVMYLGRAMEIGTAAEIFEAPAHPYTRALLEAVPWPDPAHERAKDIQPLEGDIPSPINPPSGCVFRTRCPIAKPNCIRVVPEAHKLGADHFAACHYAERLAPLGAPSRGDGEDI